MVDIIRKLRRASNEVTAFNANQQLCSDAAAKIESDAKVIAALREALEFCATFKITDSSDLEVEEDSLHEIRKCAQRAIEQTVGERK